MNVHLTMCFILEHCYCLSIGTISNVLNGEVICCQITSETKFAHCSLACFVPLSFSPPSVEICTNWNVCKAKVLLYGSGLMSF